MTQQMELLTLTSLQPKITYIDGFAWFDQMLDDDSDLNTTSGQTRLSMDDFTKRGDYIMYEKYFWVGMTWKSRRDACILPTLRYNKEDIIDTSNVSRT